MQICRYTNGQIYRHTYTHIHIYLTIKVLIYLSTYLPSICYLLVFRPPAAPPPGAGTGTRARRWRPRCPPRSHQGVGRIAGDPDIIHNT